MHRPRFDTLTVVHCWWLPMRTLGYSHGKSTKNEPHTSRGKDCGYPHRLNTARRGNEPVPGIKPKSLARSLALQPRRPTTSLVHEGGVDRVRKFKRQTRSTDGVGRCLNSSVLRKGKRTTDEDTLKPLLPRRSRTWTKPMKNPVASCEVLKTPSPSSHPSRSVILSTLHRPRRSRYV